MKTVLDLVVAFEAACSAPVGCAMVSGYLLPVGEEVIAVNYCGKEFALQVIDSTLAYGASDEILLVPAGETAWTKLMGRIRFFFTRDEAEEWKQKDWEEMRGEEFPCSYCETPIPIGGCCTNCGSNV